ncbi:Alpha/Beta hydrolase protein [Zopfochytrium polystomum]|nr:Alpha/Beta hydrolase protein [Zopfochytrium polystomum]
MPAPAAAAAAAAAADRSPPAAAAASAAGTAPHPPAKQLPYTVAALPSPAPSPPPLVLAAAAAEALSASTARDAPALCAKTTTAFAATATPTKQPQQPNPHSPPPPPATAVATKATRENVDRVVRADTTADLLRLWSYPVETHHVPVPCPSGARPLLLTLFRVPNPRFGTTRFASAASSTSADAPPKPCPLPTVLLWPGLGVDSSVFACAPDGPHANLATVLADAGKDVWLANARGSRYATPTGAGAGGGSDGSNDRIGGDSAAAAASVDEIVARDVVAVVRYVKRVTGRETLSWVGFSQGALVGLAALSVVEELEGVVDVFVGLAPAIKPPKPNSTLMNSLLSAFGPEGLYALLGRGRFLEIGRQIRPYLPASVYARLIDGAFKLLFDWDVARVGDRDRKTALYRHVFSGCSVRNVVHWCQNMHDAAATSFSHYNSGRGGASAAAASSASAVLLGLATAATAASNTTNAAFQPSQPAKYPLKHIQTTPLHIFFGTRDTFTDPAHAREHLPRAATIEMVEGYAHLDFLWATDIGVKVWPRVLEVLGEAAERGRRREVERERVETEVLEREEKVKKEKVGGGVGKGVRFREEAEEVVVRGEEECEDEDVEEEGSSGAFLEDLELEDGVSGVWRVPSDEYDDDDDYDDQSDGDDYDGGVDGAFVRHVGDDGIVFGRGRTGGGGGGGGRRSREVVVDDPSVVELEEYTDDDDDDEEHEDGNGGKNEGFSLPAVAAAAEDYGAFGAFGAYGAYGANEDEEDHRGGAGGVSSAREFLRMVRGEVDGEEEEDAGWGGIGRVSSE